ncbi:class I SAM-dependent methyltransferase [Selenomonas noxia]|uniref:class I SAM-dependent methyltransferase n=1 Tax=Selenomonas noxia TaxID=135083 RepID=UPI00288AB168|nr:class I SAM-dependent methyltransferase [Selenomonas noxia]
MMDLTKDDFEVLDRCPWDETSAEIAEFLYLDDMDCDVVRCPQCGVVYAKRRLNAKGLPKYWGDYLSRVHTHDIDAVGKRNKMYQIDYEFSSRYVPTGRVLDVGCGNGSFMDVYESHGYEVFGVEYGEEAAAAAEKRHHVCYGVFNEIDFGKEKFDLIIFRGVLQYVPYPKEYLKKAVSLLKPKGDFHAGGHLFITAQPNMGSLAFRLFGKNFTQPVTGADFIGYTENALTEYLRSLGLHKKGERYFYPETPYASEEDDLLKMARAIQYKRDGQKINFKAPAYWGNMMTLIYTGKIS